MRPPPPPRLSTLLSPRRFSSTATTAPSLLTVRDIPAPHLGHIRILSLNNPKSRNAISRQLLSELRTQIDVVRAQVLDEEVGGEVVGEGTRVLVVASEVDEAFCAGADLKERRGMSGGETRAFLTSLRSTLDAIETLPVPTIAAVASVALGGGLELALATDLRVFASTTIVGLPETRLGIIPGAGGTYRLQKVGLFVIYWICAVLGFEGWIVLEHLPTSQTSYTRLIELPITHDEADIGTPPQLIGKAEALQMILTGRRIQGAHAVKMGFAQRSVRVASTGPGHLPKARQMVLEETISMAKMICEGAPGAVQAALRAVREGTAEAEGREYERVVGMGDRDEALRAFGGKRAAVFRGR